MTAALHVCRHCDGLIVAPDDVVVMAYVDANSGPGWGLGAQCARAPPRTR
ncbi:hypothetical protein [Streptomyces sp. NPDC000878]